MTISIVMLTIKYRMLSVAFSNSSPECPYGEWHITEFHYAKWVCAEWHYAEWYYAKWNYAKRHNAEWFYTKCYYADGHCTILHKYIAKC